MDATVTARFFVVSGKPKESADFPDLLLAIMKSGDAGARERCLDGGIYVRVERCAEDADFVAGEFCRKQTSNIPPTADAKGLTPLVLSEGGGLGHMAAFRYHRPTRVLLLQHNVQSASPNRIASYLAAGNSAALFTFNPILRQDAWDRFIDGEATQFQVSFASPQNLEAIDVEGIAAAKGARLLAEAYDGMKVTISVSVGRSKKKFLNGQNLRASIDRLLGSTLVKKVKVRSGKGDEEETINFLKEHLKETKVLGLPEKDPVSNYEIRKAFLKSVFSDNLEYLQEHYGPKSP
jgi:hypothetical protein